MSIFFHEQLYRSPESMVKIRDYSVIICGAGALGANIAETLVRSGFGKLKVIDCDRIEERNLSTQPYYRSDIGAFKAKILANDLYRAIGVQIESETKRLVAANTKQILGQSSLIIDAFDNSGSRQAVKDHCDRTGQPCLHTGLASDYAEVIWNDSYRVPSDAQDDICDYPLARNLVLLTVAIACESTVDFIFSGQKRSFTVTLKDLSIQLIQ
jgi:molybdopterin-synthase adenylyltransferase